MNAQRARDLLRKAVADAIATGHVPEFEAIGEPEESSVKDKLRLRTQDGEEFTLLVFGGE